MKIPVPALLTAAICAAIAWSWRRTGERQELGARQDLVHRLLDAGQMKLADAQAQQLDDDFAGIAANARLHATTTALLEANVLLKQRRGADARARLAPIVAEADAPAAAHWLLGVALNQLGDRTAAAAEQAKARALAPDAPLFRETPAKDAAGHG